MKQVMIMLLAAGVGSAVQADYRADSGFFMKEDSSVMEVISAGVPCKDRKVDVLVRATVKSGVRFANIETVVLSGGPVRFITGINYHSGPESQNIP